MQDSPSKRFEQFWEARLSSPSAINAQNLPEVRMQIGQVKLKILENPSTWEDTATSLEVLVQSMGIQVQSGDGLPSGVDQSSLLGAIQKQFTSGDPTKDYERGYFF